MSNSQELIKPRVIHYLRATWYARWMAIAIVCASFTYLPGVNQPVVTALAILAFLYNIFLWVATKAGLVFFSNRLFLEIADSTLAVVLVIYSGGINSPYVIVLALMIVSCAYWYGALSTMALGLLQAMAIIVSDWANTGQFILPKEFLVTIAVLISLGIYVAWLSGSERSERSELLALGTEAEKERQRLLALINNMADAVLVINQKGQIIISNSAARLLLVHDQQSVDHQTIKNSLELTDATGKKVELDFHHPSTFGNKRDLRIKTHDGSYTQVAISVAPFIVGSQNHGYVVILKDVTHDKTIDREREEFVAVAAHELRTPLTIAQGNIAVLQSPQLLPHDSEAIAALEAAQRSLSQLSHIIGDLTNLARADTQQLDVEVDPLNSMTLLRELEADYTDQAKAKGLALKISIDPNIKVATILTSNYMVRQILTIFISNALKFTDKGGITLAIENLPDRPEGITFSVSDTGIGIAQSDQKKIFEKFFQSEDYMTRRHGGTGLGLFIAKKLAERLTGEVWFDTELSEGSKFYLWVPPYSRDKDDQYKVATAETKDLFSNF